MDFKKVTESRYSVRSFSNTPVEKQKINAILEAFRSAPTAMNMQPVRVYAVTDSAVVKKLEEATPCMYGAPMTFVICHDKDTCCVMSSGKSLGEMDASIAASFIMLAAVNEGLGTCWVCRFDEDKTRKILNIPDNIVPDCYMVVGYPTENAAPSERHFKRLEISESVINI